MTTFAQKTSFAGLGRKTRLSSGRPTSKDENEPNIWKAMLDDVSSGKSLPEKQLLVLGGSPDSQREFLEALNPEASNPRYYRDRRKPKTPPISNRYALGYTYHDVLDADHEDTLARLSIYMLSNPSPALAPLLTRLFTAKTVPETLITILLDWSDPWKWPHQLRQWIRLLRSVLITLDDDVKVIMEENMIEWKEKRKGVDAPTGNFGQQAAKDGVTTPAVTLGPGEWDEGLGMPLCVVCQNAEKIERLEKEFAWDEGEFDFIAQWLRTVLLKHGASCIYTTPFDTNSVQLLIHTSLGIHSLLKREIVKYNIVDRDKLLIPPNWDSWAKIRILREGFDMETVSAAWSTEIQDPPSSTFPDPNPDSQDSAYTPSSSAVTLFAATLADPSAITDDPSDPTATTTPNPLQDPSNPQVPPSSSSDQEQQEVTCPDTQTFLAEQSVLLERLKAEDARDEERERRAAVDKRGGSGGGGGGGGGGGDGADPLADFFGNDRGSGGGEGEGADGKMAEQIGPMQFNLGGIQVDADDAVRQLRERQAREREERERERGSGGGGGSAGGGAEGKGAEVENEALRDFFAGLLKKGGGEGKADGGGR